MGPDEPKDPATRRGKYRRRHDTERSLNQVPIVTQAIKNLGPDHTVSVMPQILRLRKASSSLSKQRNPDRIYSSCGGISAIRALRRWARGIASA